MSFRDFDLPTVQERFGLATDHTQPLFAAVAPVKLTAGLASYLATVSPLGMASGTEKARSEWLVSPLLSEVWLRSQRRIAVYSGLEMNVDPARGLNGVCDFVLGESKQYYFIEAPIIAVVEAKRDSIIDGMGQCAAEMVAAQIFNQQKQRPSEVTYGCITTGSLWKFLRLTGTQLDIDVEEYSIQQPERILGILLHCCGVTV
jgi:hypothetical protein